VWLATLDDCRPAHERLLDPVETVRRATYTAAADRDRFTLGVVMTRIVLGANLGLPPGRIEVDRTCPDCGRPHGQPRLATGGDVNVSVSHSGDLVVVALAAGRSVGVDVEQLDMARGLDLAEMALSPTERMHLDRLAPTDRWYGFLRYWVRKEAVLKATGEGLRVPLTDLAVSAPDEQPRLVGWTGRPELPVRVSMVDLWCGPGYVASLAIMGGHPAVHEIDAGPLIRLLGRAGLSR
jgi:4'-phosphopantetheinyl transferase